MMEKSHGRLIPNYHYEGPKHICTFSLFFFLDYFPHWLPFKNSTFDFGKSYLIKILGSYQRNPRHFHT